MNILLKAKKSMKGKRFVMLVNPEFPKAVFEIEETKYNDNPKHYDKYRLVGKGMRQIELNELNVGDKFSTMQGEPCDYEVIGKTQVEVRVFNPITCCSYMLPRYKIVFVSSKN